MRSYIFLIGIIVASLFAFPAYAWTTDLSVSSGGVTIPLVIGMSDAATQDYDNGIDIPLPPPFPGSTFKAYLAGFGLFPMLQTDIRDVPEWRLHADAEDPILITWKAAPIPLMITIDGITHPMDTSGDATLSPGSYRMLIEPFKEHEDLLPGPTPAASAPSTSAPPPAESGISFMPMFGGLIIALCALCIYPRRMNP